MSAVSWFADNADTIIALSALAVAVHQGILSRQHARKSVHPHITIETQCQNIPPQIQILVRNDGIGPAFLRNLSVKLDGRQVEPSTRNTWIDIGHELQLPIRWGGGWWITPGEGMRPSSTRILAKWCTNETDKDPEFSNVLAGEQLNRLEIRIDYESAYGEKFSAEMERV